MTKPISLLLGLLWSAIAYSQTYDISSDGTTDTVTSCAGILRDPGGSGIYPNYSDGTFIIDPAGNPSISMVFSSFNIRTYDYIEIYDGISGSGNYSFIGSYSGTSLPNSGNAITASNGAVTVVFYSNSSGNASGFELSWSTSATTPEPTASFSVNTTSPSYNTPVQFINTTTNGGSYLWDFGDGHTSTERNPIHSFTQSGPNQVRLISSNCTGSDTSSYTTINVQAPPQASLSDDTISLSVACGTSGSGSLIVSNSGSGSLNYDISLNQPAANLILDADFENNGYDGFVNNSNGSASSSIVNTGAPEGSGYLEITGYSSYNNPFRNNFGDARPQNIHYKVKSDSYTSYHGYLQFGKRDQFNNFNYISSSVFTYGNFRIYYRDQYGNIDYHNANYTQGNWIDVKLRNIDFDTQTYDIYLNDNLVVTEAHFYNALTSINEIVTYNNNTSTYGIDDIEISANDLLRRITFNPKTGTIGNGNNNVIFINADATGLNAGTYWLNFEITSNDTALDGTTVPLKLEVTGSAVLNQNKACILFNSVMTGRVKTDSLLLFNSGCDTLTISGLNTDLSEYATTTNRTTLAPDDSAYVYVSFTPGSASGILNDTLEIVSSDTTLTVCLSGTVIPAPQSQIDSSQINATLNSCNDSVLIQRTFYNNGAGELNYKVGGSGLPDLQDVLDTFRASYNTITPLIPDMYHFSDGIYNNSISDGGNDMYDGGNMLSTDINSTYLDYSHDLIINSSSLGANGQYFTYKGNGIWLFAADLDGVNSFEINGDLGADGSGNVDGTTLNTNINGQSYTGFVKRVYNAGDPSVNHLVMIPTSNTASHSHPVTTNADQHVISGLGNTERIYYLLYASNNNSSNYINDATTLSIMKRFLNLINSSTLSSWVSVSPDSGVVTSNDSVVLDIWVKSGNLNSGTYNTTIDIATNDPADPMVSIDVSLTLNGSPNIQSNVTCAHFDTTMAGTVRTDSILIYNTGCADLNLSALNTDLAEFTAVADTLELAPGDSTYIRISFAPGTTLGTLRDTLDIASNDTIQSICLNGYALGAPNASVTPDSIYRSFSSCSDSVTIPINLSNVSGLSSLDYKIAGGGQSGEVNVVVLSTYAYTNELSNVLSILNQEPSLNVISTNATSEQDFQNDLKEADVLIIPESYSSLNNSPLLPLIRSFCREGGNLITLRSISSRLTAMNILPIDYISSSYNDFINADPDHPIMEGIPSVIASGGYSAYQIAIDSGSYTVLVKDQYSSLPNEAISFIHNYGKGLSVFIGFDYYSYNSNMSLMLTQSVKWLKSQSGLPEYLSINPDSGSVATGDSIILNLTINTTGLMNGSYTNDIVIQTNDPANPEISIPVIMDINGQGETTLPNSCQDLDSSYVGLEKTQILPIVNTGCDTLIINDNSSSTGQFYISNLPLKIAPGDSISASLSFTPDTIGIRTDTLFIYSNADSSSICVEGIGKGAPKVDPAVDTMRVRLNKCNGFTIENFSFSNTGQGTLEYSDISIMEYYRDTSRENYFTSGATTNHTFHDMPSSADTIFFKVVVNGDFSSYYESYTVRVEGTDIGNTVGSYSIDGEMDTTVFFYTGSNISNWLSDGTLNVSIINNYDVNYGYGLDLHFVEVTAKSTPDWASVLSSKTGSLANGGSTTKNILLEGNDLNPGTYTSNIIISSNDPVHPDFEVPLIFDLVNEPEIFVSKSCIDFGLVSDTVRDSLYVKNNGCTNLLISGLQFNSSDFSSDQTSYTIPPEDSIWIPINFAPSASGNINSSFVLNNNDSLVNICLLANVIIVPLADFEYVVNGSCTGEVTFASNSQNNPTSWEWDFGDGKKSYREEPVHTYEKPGIYTVKMIASNLAGSDTTTTTLDLSNILYVDFSSPDSIFAGHPTQFYDSSEVGTSWQWFFGDGNTSTLQHPVHTYANPGTYFITYKVSSISCNKTINREIEVMKYVGIEESHTLINIFPVPASDKLRVNWEGYGHVTQLLVHSLDGKLLLAQDVSGDSYDIDVNSFSEGMYILNIINDQGKAEIRKFTVER